MGLGTEVVDLVGLQMVEQLHHLDGVGEVAVVEEEMHPVDVRIAVEVVDAAGVEGGGAADDPVDLVAFGEQQLGEVGTVLAGDAGDEGFFHASAQATRGATREASPPRPAWQAEEGSRGSEGGI